MDGGSEGCQSALPYGTVRYRTMLTVPSTGPTLSRVVWRVGQSAEPHKFEWCIVWYCQ